MTTYYDVLGLERSASPDDVRRAYRERARLLHPDTAGGATEARQRAMQDLNEAWRVLRDPGTRAAYDAWLESPPAAAGDDGVDPLDRPYHHRSAEPGDVSIAIVRAIPWLAVLAVLAIIFLVTAYAGGDDSPERCVNPGSGLSGPACPENPGE